MTPVDQFLHSVQESFAANRSTHWTKVGLLMLPAIALSLGLSVLIRRRRLQRALASRIHSVSSGAGLSGADLEDLTRIAAISEVPVIQIMTVLSSFEHATARLLAGEAPTLHPIGGSWFERVRRLRRALGFSPLSAHLWLLSTRELVAGDLVSIGSTGGHVSEVNEASFAVDWPLTAMLVEGAPSEMTIVRAEDTRYRSQVRLLRVEALSAITTESGGGSAGRRAFFAHDEHPERQQDRAYIRLRVSVSVRVQIIDPIARVSSDPTFVATSIAGTIVDVSAGGLSLNLPVSSHGPIARGAHVLCWFTLDSHATFEALEAVVMATGPEVGSPPGEQHLRLSFVSVDEAERDRLASAVASSRPPAKC